MGPQDAGSRSSRSHKESRQRRPARTPSSEGRFITEPAAPAEEGRETNGGVDREARRARWGVDRQHQREAGTRNRRGGDRGWWEGMGVGGGWTRLLLTVGGAPLGCPPLRPSTVSGLSPPSPPVPPLPATQEGCAGCQRCFRFLFPVPTPRSSCGTRTPGPVPAMATLRVQPEAQAKVRAVGSRPGL